MKEIFNALKVQSELQLNKLLESLDLTDEQYLEVMDCLSRNNDSMTMRENVLNLMETFGNDSDKKLKDYINNKKEPRKLKEETIYDHSWYEVKGGKYPKRTKEGVICESVEDETLRDTEDVENVKHEEVEDSDIAQFIETSKSVIENTTNSSILKGILQSIESKLPFASGTSQINELGELKQTVETKLAASLKIENLSETIINEDWESDGIASAEAEAEEEYQSNIWKFKPYVASIDTDDIDEGNVSVLIKDQNSEFNAWIDCYEQDGTIECEWNKQMFLTTDSDSVLQMKYQNNGDVSDDSFGLVIDYLFDKGYAYSDDKGYEHFKVDEDDEEENNEWTGEEFDEAYNPDEEPIFDIGDKVEFVWDDEKVEGRVIKVSYLLSNRYYDIISWNNKEQRNENYVRIDPVSSEMKRVPDNDFEEDEDLEETCTSGSTCAGNIASYAKGFGKIKKRKNKNYFDVDLFKEAIITNTPSELHLNEHFLKYFKNDGKFYLRIDESLVKSFNKNYFIESVDKVFNNDLGSIDLLENYTCYEMDILMEAEEEMNDAEKAEKKNDLIAKMNTKQEVAIEDEDTGDITQNVEILSNVSDEDTGEETDEYVVKDKTTNKVHVINMKDIKGVQQ